MRCIMEEIWKDVVGYEGFYMVSNLGNVKRIKCKKHHDGKLLKPQKGRSYLLVGLSKNGIQTSQRVHRLVAEAFIENPNNYPVINHINQNKHDNRVENLEWCTYKYNNDYGKPIKPKKIVKNHIGVKRKVRCIETSEIFSSQTSAAKKCGIVQSGIVRCCKGKQKSAGGFHWEYA